MSTPTSSDSKPVLEVTDLAISYSTRKSQVPAVRGVSFSVRPGETVGLVGESGCGKSTIAFGILDFLGGNGKVVNGSIRFKDEELVGKSRQELRQIRGNQISMVYQDPMQALNPTLPIGEQLTEVLTTHQAISRSEAQKKSLQMLDRVYMPDAKTIMKRYPHMVSGGQQQRVVIAMAMLNNPALLIMDEPTTALDVTVEAAVLDLIEDLKKDFNTGIIFITHNLGVVARVSDRLCVMYAGELVEKGQVTEIFTAPAHPYTRGLLCCIPRLTDSLSNTQLWSIRGSVPHPSERDRASCIFLPRCDWHRENRPEYSAALMQCGERHPELLEVSKEHHSRCVLGAATLKTPWDDYFRGKMRQLSTDEDDDEATADFDKNLAIVRNLKVYYEHDTNSLKDVLKLREKSYIKAVDDVSLRIKKGSILGIVGESGCGKSTLVKGLIGLEKIRGGSAELMGVDISTPVFKRSLDTIKELQMVFQNPDSTLNPTFSIGKQIARPIRKFKTAPRHKVRKEVEKLLSAVKLDAYYYDRLPRQLSGGEKQRAGIARALASKPNLIICDEPVSALDVSVQATVLNLLNDIKFEFGSTLIFIAHDLSVMRFISDFIAVMYLGKIVEYGPVDRIYPPPYHPYTEALLSAVPIADPTARSTRIRLEGDVPSALNPPSGCHFHTRCHRRNLLADGGGICEKETPPRQKTGDGHFLYCHIPIETLQKAAAETGD
ncbi:ABC transporter ATP-binding protein [bacterium]|nr:ABC transporter ATP-binding protein [bacterium]